MTEFTIDKLTFGCDFSPIIYAERKFGRTESWMLTFDKEDIEIECNEYDNTSRVWVNIQEMKDIIAQYEEMQHEYKLTHADENSRQLTLFEV